MGQDHGSLEAQHRIYSEAWLSNLGRWSEKTRNWTPVTAVTLNPERGSVVAVKLRTANENRQTA